MSDLNIVFFNFLLGIFILEKIVFVIDLLVVLLIAIHRT